MINLNFFFLLESTINIDEFIPLSFINNFYASTGIPCKYPLKGIFWALIIQLIFSIPTDSLLIIFLNCSKDLRDFCGFSKVPDASKFTRFKQDFLLDLQFIFHKLVNLTEPICQNIDTHKSSMTIFDTSSIEAFVTENNPKYANKVVKQLKAYKKSADLMTLMILINLLMVLCHLMPFAIKRLKSSTLTDIFVMSINLNSLPMYLAL